MFFSFPFPTPVRNALSLKSAGMPWSDDIIMNDFAPKALGWAYAKAEFIYLEQNALIRSKIKEVTNIFDRKGFINDIFTNGDARFYFKTERVGDVTFISEFKAETNDFLIELFTDSAATYSERFKKLASAYAKKLGFVPVTENNVRLAGYARCKLNDDWYVFFTNIVTSKHQGFVRCDDGATYVVPVYLKVTNSGDVIDYAYAPHIKGFKDYDTNRTFKWRIPEVPLVSLWNGKLKAYNFGTIDFHYPFNMRDIYEKQYDFGEFVSSLGNSVVVPNDGKWHKSVEFSCDGCNLLIYNKVGRPHYLSKVVFHGNGFDYVGMCCQEEMPSLFSKYQTNIYRKARNKEMGRCYFYVNTDKIFAIGLQNSKPRVTTGAKSGKVTYLEYGNIWFSKEKFAGQVYCTINHEKYGRLVVLNERQDSKGTVNAAKGLGYATFFPRKKDKILNTSSVRRMVRQVIDDELPFIPALKSHLYPAEIRKKTPVIVAKNGLVEKYVWFPEDIYPLLELGRRRKVVEGKEFESIMDSAKIMYEIRKGSDGCEGI